MNWDLGDTRRKIPTANGPVLSLIPTDNGAYSLIAERARAGLVTDSPEVLIKNTQILAHDRELRDAYGDAGRTWAEEHFSIATMADRSAVSLANCGL